MGPTRGRLWGQNLQAVGLNPTRDRQWGCDPAVGRAWAAPRRPEKLLQGLWVRAQVGHFKMFLETTCWGCLLLFLKQTFETTRTPGVWLGRHNKQTRSLLLTGLSLLPGLGASRFGSCGCAGGSDRLRPGMPCGVSLADYSTQFHPNSRDGAPGAAGVLLFLWVWGEGPPSCAGAVALAVRPHSSVCSSPAHTRLYVHQSRLQDALGSSTCGATHCGVNMLLLWLYKSFLLFSSLLSWFQWAELYTKLGPKCPAFLRLNTVCLVP